MQMYYALSFEQLLKFPLLYFENVPKLYPVPVKNICRMNLASWPLRVSSMKTYPTYFPLPTEKRNRPVTGFL